MKLLVPPAFELECILHNKLLLLNKKKTQYYHQIFMKFQNPQS